MKEKIEYTDTINYVVTTQPDLVAGYIDELNERIAELEQELTELKEKAIVSKFKIGQEVWIVIDKMFSNSYVAKFKIKTFIPDRYGIVLMLENKMNDIDYCYEWQVYTTREEAEKKLQELRGGE